MTQEDKNLVLKDMCSRVPYKLRLWIKLYEGKPDYFIKSHNILSSVNYTEAFSPRISIEGALYDIEGPEYSCGEQYIKPYLRPMSSMTNEERKELSDYLCEQVMSNKIGITIPPNPTQGKGIPFIWMGDCLDWLNAHHFDYRGLIDKGLALEAPNNMY